MEKYLFRLKVSLQFNLYYKRRWKGNDWYPEGTDVIAIDVGAYVNYMKQFLIYAIPLEVILGAPQFFKRKNFLNQMRALTSDQFEMVVPKDKLVIQKENQIIVVLENENGKTIIKTPNDKGVLVKEQDQKPTRIAPTTITGVNNYVEFAPIRWADIEVRDYHPAQIIARRPFRAPPDANDGFPRAAQAAAPRGRRNPPPPPRRGG